MSDDLFGDLADGAGKKTPAKKKSTKAKPRLPLSDESKVALRIFAPAKLIEKHFKSHADTSRGNTLTPIKDDLFREWYSKKSPPP